MIYLSHGLHQSFLIPTRNMFNLANCGSNLILIEMTFPLIGITVGITLLSVKTSVSLDVGKSVLWQTSIATLEREI